MTGDINNNYFCELCKKGNIDGVAVYRANPKGVPGIFGCMVCFDQVKATVEAKKV